MDQQKFPNGVAMWLAGAALGAAAMYFADPRQGRRRRALLRDKLYSVSLDAIDARDATMRDLGNRLDGLRAKLRRGAEGSEPAASEQALGARVRSLLGRLVTHPHAITVTASGGHLVFSGAILADEREMLLAEAYKVPGVTAIDDRLTAYASPQGVPALQGSHRVPGQPTWRPALQALAGAGGMLGIVGLSRRSTGGLLLAGTGLAMLARAATALRHGNLHSLQQETVTHLERSIEVSASPEAVFDAWNDFENFPHFFARLLMVKAVDDRRSLWVIQETANTKAEGNVIWRRRVRPSMLAWQSEGNAALGLAGTVMFEPTAHGTRVSLRLTMPPQSTANQAAAADGHGRDFGRELDKDLIRMKSFIESGVVPHHATGSSRPEGGQLLH